MAYYIARSKSAHSIAGHKSTFEEARMGLQSRIRFHRAKRLMALATALLLAALVAIPASGMALAQAPAGDEIVLVNAEREFVERKGDGRFVARPVFDREVDLLYYGVRHPDTGEFIAGLFRVQDDPKRRSDGWEYSWEYEKGDEFPELDPEWGYLLLLVAEDPAGTDPQDFHGVIPIHEPGGIWNKILGALDPSRWARAAARWMIEGVHGTLCGVVEKATGADADNCRGG